MTRLNKDAQTGLRDRPQHLQVTLQKALQDWPQWETGLDEPPSVLGELRNSAQASSPNRVYLLQAGQSRLLLKLQQRHPVYTPTQAERRTSMALQKAAAVIRLAPEIIYACPDRGYLLQAYIDGELLLDRAPEKIIPLKAICAAMRAYHSMPNLQGLPAFDYVARCEAYLQRAKQSLATATYERFCEGWGELRSICVAYQDNADAKRAPCHHDLNRCNILLPADNATGQGVRFIDWEYAGLGLASMDFASLGVELGITAETLAPISGIAVHELLGATRIYRFLCAVYMEILASAAQKQRLAL
ncbi:MAG: phosphotransferase [Pseudomonadales bacterium]